MSENMPEYRSEYSCLIVEDSPMMRQLLVLALSRVKSLRVIRDQVTALNGHQVEVIGSLSGIPGQSRSVLVTDSDKAKLYIGGGDKNLGEDLGVDRNEPPTVYARTIKEVAEKCLAAGG